MASKNGKPRLLASSLSQPTTVSLFALTHSGPRSSINLWFFEQLHPGWGCMKNFASIRLSSDPTPPARTLGYAGCFSSTVIWSPSSLVMQALTASIV